MSERKRIAFLASHLLSPMLASGGDILFAEIAARLRRRRPQWEIIVVAPDFAQDQLARFFERVVVLPTGRGEGRQGGAGSVALTWARRLKGTAQTLRELKPDLVHSTGDFFPDVWPAVWTRRAARCRWSGVVHHINASPFRRKNAFFVGSVSYALQRSSFFALRGADAIALLNSGVREELKSIGFEADRLHVIGCGIDLDRVPFIESTEPSKRALWINRLEPTKGLFDLPRIIARLPAEMVIDVVGRGPEIHVRRLRRMLDVAGLSQRCLIHGFLSDRELHDVALRAGVYISCSYEEGWGISIAEALAMGLPCVTYDLPSHREIFGEAITRVPVGDTEAFAQKIAEMLTKIQTRDERSERRRLAGQYSLDACAQRQELVFAELLEGV